jgi:hypothetical protein
MQSICLPATIRDCWLGVDKKHLVRFVVIQVIFAFNYHLKGKLYKTL